MALVKADFQDEGPGVAEVDYDFSSARANEFGAAINALQGYSQMVGAIAADSEATITHNRNSMVLEVTMMRSAMLTVANGGSAISGIGPLEEVPCNWTLIQGNPNAIKLKPSVGIAANECFVIIKPVPQATGEDTGGPGAGVLSTTAQGLTTINLTLTGGTDAGVGLAGVEWYRSPAGAGTPVLVGTTEGSTFQDTGRTSGTTYDYTAKRFDLLGKLGTVSNLLSVSTVTPSNVVLLGTVTQGYDAADGTVTARPVYPAGTLTMSVAIVKDSHSQWVASEAAGAATANYSLVVNGTQSGGWTRYFPTATGGQVSPDVGAGGGQQSGGVHVFYKLSPNTAWTTDDVTFTASGSAITPVGVAMTIFHLGYVDQTTPFNAVATETQSVSPLSLGIASVIGDLTIMGYVMHSANGSPSGYNRTQLGSTQGGNVAGYAHYLLCGYLATAATATITHSTSAPTGSADATILLNVKKA